MFNMSIIYGDTAITYNYIKRNIKILNKKEDKYIIFQHTRKVLRRICKLFTNGLVINMFSRYEDKTPYIIIVYNNEEEHIIKTIVLMSHSKSKLYNYYHLMKHYIEINYDFEFLYSFNFENKDLNEVGRYILCKLITYIYEKSESEKDNKNTMGQFKTIVYNETPYKHINNVLNDFNKDSTLLFKFMHKSNYSVITVLIDIDKTKKNSMYNETNHYFNFVKKYGYSTLFISLC